MFLEKKVLRVVDADGLLHHAVALFTCCSFQLPRGLGRIALGSFVLAMAIRTLGRREVQMLLDPGDASIAQHLLALNVVQTGRELVFDPCLETDEEVGHHRGCRPIFVLG